MLWLQENICHGFWMSHTVAAHLYCSVCGQEPTCSHQIAASSMVRNEHSSLVENYHFDSLSAAVLGWRLEPVAAASVTAASAECDAYHAGAGAEARVVPADMLLLAGTCIVEEAVLTGESHPQWKTPVGNLGAGPGESWPILGACMWQQSMCAS